MRRALGIIGLIGLGVLLGFVVRLVWPRRSRLSLDSYGATGAEPGWSPMTVDPAGDGI